MSTRSCRLTHRADAGHSVFVGACCHNDQERRLDHVGTLRVDRIPASCTSAMATRR